MNVKNNSFQFAEGSFVVCPSHGLGKVSSIENQIIAGQTLHLYKIYFSKDKLTSYIPTANSRSKGLRKLCTKSTAERVFSVLLKPSRVGRGMWSRRAQEYESKIQSGSILLTAEVVRDLFGGVNDPNRSYSERIIFENALYRLVSEMAVVLKMTPESVDQRISGILSESYAMSVKASDIKKDDSDDFDDGDLESFSDDKDDDDLMTA